jgi:bifunctional UDP-N-acetylglucosamine pyrophosphorylase/glucosamine-1-phosphate N-acetyltransferase
VLSKESESARAIVGDDAEVAMQDPPRGTGDAVRVALGAIKDGSGDAFIVYGDTPLLRAGTLRALAELRAKRGAPLALLSGMIGTANAYGRIVRDASGDVARIVEARLATPEERGLPESNLGAYAVDLAWLRRAVPRLRANETGEVFLTDLVALAVAEGSRVAAHRTDDPDEAMGVNTRVELAAAEDVLRRRIRERHAHRPVRDRARHGGRRALPRGCLGTRGSHARGRRHHRAVFAPPPRRLSREGRPDGQLR